MNLLYELTGLPATAWRAELPLSAEAEVGRWVDEQLDAAGVRVRKLGERTLETAQGWPMRLAAYAVDEQRLVVATYEFFDQLAGLAIGGLEPGWLDVHHEAIATMLREVQPDWSTDEPQTLRALWTESVT